MSHDPQGSIPDRWARFRFEIIGRLLAAPPESGALRSELQALSKQTWVHPVTKEPVQFAFSTLERWFLRARNARLDPVGQLRRKVRKDHGTHLAMHGPLCPVLRAQYQAHPRWSYQLHMDNLAARVRKDPSLGRMPSYATVRRWMQAQGMFRKKRLPHAHREGAVRAHAAREQREVRSYEVTHVHGLWHLDFHTGSRKVLTSDGRWILPHLLGVIDDHSRLLCHAQWYVTETAEDLIHGLSQAIQKRGLPRALLTDNGAAMVAQETTEGLLVLGIEHDTTREYSPEQNAKMEVFWAQIEGRLMAMLEGHTEPTLALLNEATQAWVEGEYHLKIHDEIGTTPLDRFVHGPSVGRPSPSSEALRRAFRMKTQRTQRRSDGTFVLEGRRFEVPSRYRSMKKLSIRYARWDLSCVDLYDERHGTRLCPLYPLDKAANADRRRRRVDSPLHPWETSSSNLPTPDGIAPRLQELMEQYAATGLPPAYLAKDTGLPAERTANLDPTEPRP